MIITHRYAESNLISNNSFNTTFSAIGSLEDKDKGFMIFYINLILRDSPSFKRNFGGSPRISFAFSLTHS